MEMKMTQVADYLRRINPVYRKRNGRWVIGSESRQRTFKAVEEVLRAGCGLSQGRRGNVRGCPAARGRNQGCMATRAPLS
jgi:hypothetical protein